MTAYEFDILEVRTAKDDAAESDEPDWQIFTGSMTAHSRDGWELVSVQISAEAIVSKFGEPRTERRAFSVWRRPLADS